MALWYNGQSPAIGVSGTGFSTTATSATLPTGSTLLSSYPSSTLPSTYGSGTPFTLPPTSSYPAPAPAANSASTAASTFTTLSYQPGATYTYPSTSAQPATATTSYYVASPAGSPSFAYSSSARAAAGPGASPMAPASPSFQTSYAAAPATPPLGTATFSTTSFSSTNGATTPTFPTTITTQQQPFLALPAPRSSTPAIIPFDSFTSAPTYAPPAKPAPSYDPYYDSYPPRQASPGAPHSPRRDPYQYNGYYGAPAYDPYYGSDYYGGGYDGYYDPYYYDRQAPPRGGRGGRPYYDEYDRYYDPGPAPLRRKTPSAELETARSQMLETRSVRQRSVSPSAAQQRAPTMISTALSASGGLGSPGPKAPRILQRGGKTDEELPPCHACSTPVNDDSHMFKVDGRVFHAECFRCTSCDIVLGSQPGDSYRHGELYYCAHDFHTEAQYRCVFCSEQLKGSRITNIHGEDMCAKHLNEKGVIVQCVDCGRIVPRFSAARQRCRNPSHIQCDCCQRTSVQNEKQSKAVFKKVHELLYREYSFTYGAVVHLALLSLSQLQSAIANHPHRNAPYPVGAYTRAEVIEGTPTVKWIGLPLGVSEDRAAMLLAHELMHVYLYRNIGAARLPVDVEEGLCELLTFLYLTSSEELEKEYSKYWEDKMASTADPVFNHGFWRAKQSFELFAAKRGAQNALPALLNYVVKHKVLPV